MPIFIYKASDSHNALVEGTMSAPTAEEVAINLKKKNLDPISIKVNIIASKHTGSLPIVEKITFCRYTSTMLESGLSLSEGMPVLKDESKNKVMRQIITDIVYHLEQGHTLSIALENYPKVFDKFFITLVKAGEVSGTLGSSFKFLEEQLRAEYSLSQKVKSALMYPAVIVVAMIGIGSLMAFFILPQIGEVFLRMTIPLPALTKTLFTTAVTVAKYRIPIMLGGLFASIMLIIFFRRPLGKKVIFKLISPIPVVNRLIQKIDMARFCRIFSTLIASAVPITDSLTIALSSLSHPHYAKISPQVIDSIMHGKSMAGTFKELKVFPPLLIQMILAGEKSGTLDSSLKDLADFYEEEVSEAVKKSTQLIEPIIMLIVGIGVGAMILAIIAPLYSVIGNLQEMSTSN
jgi:type IV pilus assembly protein PilC